MRARLSLAVVTILTALTVAVVAPAAKPDTGTLTPGGTVWWDGVFGSPEILTPETSWTKCALGACDEFGLTVALGAGYWTDNAGALEISIKWEPYDGETDLDLYVYDDAGAEVARSNAVDSDAESVFIPNAADGEYEIRVALSHGLNPPIAYKGIAQVEHPIVGDPENPQELLPNLIALPPTNFKIATAGGIIPQPENPLVSCYPEETVEDPSHPTRCLRFNQIIGNTGTGKLELRFNLPDGATSTGGDDQRLVQRIYRDNGTYVDRLADKYEFHAVHGHVHYTGFGQSALYPCEWTNGVPHCGAAPAAQGKKVGFCVIDVVLLPEFFGAPGNGPRNHTFPTCNIPTDDEWMVQGIDPGWADVYGWNLPDQYINITNLPDGLYRLEQVANPKALEFPPDPHAVLESNLGDNRASSHVCIQGDSVRGVSTQEDADSCGGPSTQG